ncbi:MAG: hypothetical protein KAS16_00780 [Thermoplasmata archaeon]|nr:hypothetical protein [Thermoplasmata archaeon]
MSSELFDELVEILHSAGVGEAKEIIHEQCEIIGKTPEDLAQDDSRFLILSLMSQLGDSIPKDKWEIVDERFKELFNEEVTDFGKVKGGVIKRVMSFFSFKRGTIGLEQLEKITIPSSKIRNEGWYPISILNEILTEIENLSATTGFNRAKVIGEYIIINNPNMPMHYWFGILSNEQIEAFSNIDEMFILDDHSVSVANGCCIYSFNGINSDQLQQFVLGICEGIQKFRTGRAGSVELFPLDDGHTQIIIEADPNTFETGGWA